MEKRSIRVVPEVKGCYGPRVWVSATDTELRCIFRVLSVWPNFTQTRSTDMDYELCYELPFGFLETDIWRNILSRMNIITKED